jgi:hypothetical protein
MIMGIFAYPPEKVYFRNLRIVYDLIREILGPRI